MASILPLPPGVVGDFVGRAHVDLGRVTELLNLYPTLIHAAFDWGNGDWETALGAASHVGDVKIAELLIAHGAQPTIFSATMLGQIEVVKAFVAAVPGIQRTRGPHGITLMAHARAGGDRAAAVAAFLETLGDADVAYPAEPLADADRDAVAGTYAFGSGSADTFAVTVHPRFGLQIARGSGNPARLIHTGRRVFHPVGASAVRMTFAAGSPCRTMSVVDGDIALTASRV